MTPTDPAAVEAMIERQIKCLESLLIAGGNEIALGLAINALFETLPEAAALREALTKMRGYAVHDDDCGLNALLMPRPPLTKQCTCGLSDLIKENHDG